MLPFSIGFIIVSLFYGRRKSAALIGKVLTNTSAMFLESTIPKMSANDSFPDFKSNIIKAFKTSKLLYDIEIPSENDEFVEFKILNCPFTSALKDYGTTELCRFACAGDFIIANRNNTKWKFTRTHSHGTDGICCNHTYYSIHVKNKETEKKKQEVGEE
jgi:hypothetical protein